MKGFVMNDREFEKVMKQLSDEAGRLSLQEVEKADVDVLDEIVHYLVTRRMPIVKEFVSPNISREWLSACGYLYKTKGSHFTFIHLSEHKFWKRS